MKIPCGDMPHLASLHIHEFPERWRMPGLVWKVNLSSGSLVMKGWWFNERCIDLASFRFEFLINSHGWREIIKMRLINETGNGQDLHSGSFPFEDPAVLMDEHAKLWYRGMEGRDYCWKQDLGCSECYLTLNNVILYELCQSETLDHQMQCLSKSVSEEMRRLRKISRNFWSWNFENVINGCLLNVTLISRGSNRERWWTVSLIIQFYDIQNYTDVMVEFIWLNG